MTFWERSKFKDGAYFLVTMERTLWVCNIAPEVSVGYDTCRTHVCRRNMTMIPPFLEIQWRFYLEKSNICISRIKTLFFYEVSFQTVRIFLSPTIQVTIFSFFIPTSHWCDTNSINSYSESNLKGPFGTAPVPTHFLWMVTLSHDIFATFVCNALGYWCMKHVAKGPC